MRTALLAFLLMTTVSGYALAKDKTDGKSESLAVEKVVCNKLYIPATGKDSPTYQPGVDVDGKSVVPADINAAPAAMTPDYVEVPMTLDLAKKLGTLRAGAEMKLPVANLKLYQNGKVEYNGQDITSNAATLCGVDAKQSKTPAAVPAATTTTPSIPAAPAVMAPPAEYVPEIPPEETEAVPGSVAPSTTGPEPKVIYKLQQGTAARSPSASGM